MRILPVSTMVKMTVDNFSEIQVITSDNVPQKDLSGYCIHNNIIIDVGYP